MFFIYTLAHTGFADATLVVLAEEADIDEVFTLDMRGFQAIGLMEENHLRFGRGSCCCWTISP
jgi:hypothetical protein